MININTVTLWAMWKSAVPTTLQEFGNYCDKMQTNQTLTLKDTRDSNSYIVAKLLDGKCWMVQNLRIAGRSISSSDSDMSSGSFTIPVSSASNFAGANNNAAYVNSSYGGYYSWYTATAGTGTYAMASGNATKSICPKGWQLPTGGSNGDYQNLATNYNGQSFTSCPVPCYSPVGGIRNNSGGLTRIGEYDTWWTSTANSDQNAHQIAIQNKDTLVPTDSADKAAGNSIRCLAK